MSANMSLLLNVARNLRYRHLGDTIGQSVSVAGRHTIADDALAFVRRYCEECGFEGPQQKYLEGQIAKYGILDLSFRLPHKSLDENYVSGVPLLRELGFDGSGINDEDWEGYGDEKYAWFEELAKDIADESAFLRLFMRCSDPSVASGSVTEMMGRLRDFSSTKFPLTFIIVDACITNSTFVWMNKHFYL
ncbi:MAG: hypothetical protein AAF333_02685 [Planctomycetota bacterium]